MLGIPRNDAVSKPDEGQASGDDPFSNLIKEKDVHDSTKSRDAIERM